jgi:RNA polymerase sigma-70 factor, ECF subfamily
MIRPSISLVSPMRLRPVPTPEPVAETQVSGGSQSSESVHPATRPEVNKSTIESLIQQNYAGLRLLLRRRTGDPEVAADLLNEAVCITWEKWQESKIERPEEIAGYIFQVALNLLRNRRRAMGERAGARADNSRLDALADDSETRDSWAERQIAARVKRVIASMSTPRDRLILTRFYLEEQDKETICRDLNLDALQFDKVLHRARGRLKSLLEAQGLGKSDLLSVLVLA